MPILNVTLPAHGGMPATKHTILPKLGESMEMFLDLYALTHGKKVSPLTLMSPFPGIIHI